MGQPPGKQDLLQGTLDLLVLRTLSPQPMHGWGIAQRISRFPRVSSFPTYRSNDSRRAAGDSLMR